jgi:hypothetical protein
MSTLTWRKSDDGCTLPFLKSLAKRIHASLLKGRDDTVPLVTATKKLISTEIWQLVASRCCMWPLRMLYLVFCMSNLFPDPPETCTGKAGSDTLNADFEVLYRVAIRVMLS